MVPPKSLFTRIAEAAGLFCLSSWLVRTGICLLQSVWGWIVGLCIVGAVIVVGLRLYRHYKDTHF